ncbi:hypothetical protein AMELA_G00182840 [Ameiurus melas]|uniref:Uncharacterized protein n=1 Tax=Ameiurus melas TaxID=219545 RepID=A0A7J6ADE2_AMEME|nr:hypothetical protein AMELA_G00182840 [Ameiurus melas]
MRARWEWWKREPGGNGGNESQVGMVETRARWEWWKREPGGNGGNESQVGIVEMKARRLANTSGIFCQSESIEL